jgi:hypothetical protein
LTGEEFEPSYLILITSFVAKLLRDLKIVMLSHDLLIISMHNNTKGKSNF